MAAPAGRTSTPARYQSGLHRYAILLAAATLLLVVAGASVTSNQAGLSVPDWPLSYGKLMPEMTGGIFFEHGHRMVATAVGLLTIVMAAWLWRRESRRWLRRLGLAAVAAVVAQGILGGMTVIFLLPKAVSIGHACLAQLFFAATVAIALFTSRTWMTGTTGSGGRLDSAPGGELRRLGIAVPAAAFAQLALGAAYRHKAIGLAPHVLGAAAVTVLVLFFWFRVLTKFPGPGLLPRSAAWLVGITLAQVFLGVGAYMSRVATTDAVQPMPVMVVFTVAHVAVGALTTAASVVCSIVLLGAAGLEGRRPAAAAADLA